MWVTWVKAEKIQDMMETNLYIQPFPFGHDQNHPYFLSSIAWIKYLQTLEKYRIANIDYTKLYIR